MQLTLLARLQVVNMMTGCIGLAELHQVQLRSIAAV